ncbi:hypothetical protein BV25DRAFT_1921682 [Artomyces pyxidatus]|uniref:Uncharacterized protein n=1 Tax=Artomyces pyxidatus TaxID=48021 RepID=A0ACB8SID5_9AGAM|nr:hypothetical protein BV25DRAFT_1921682 [Artomyces pyxidatus]
MYLRATASPPPLLTMLFSPCPPCVDSSRGNSPSKTLGLELECCATGRNPPYDGQVVEQDTLLQPTGLDRG